MSKTQSFYQSILQNSTLVVKVSGKICDNQQSIENVIGDVKELLSTITKLKVVLVFGFGRQLDHYMKNVHQIEPKKVNGRRITSQDDIEAAKKISPKVEARNDPKDALDLALSLADPDDVVMGTGSLYVVGALREAYLANRR